MAPADERESPGRLFFTVGLAALITGLFGLGTEIQKERHDYGVQQCQIAQQLLADDRLNDDVDRQDRRRLLTLAKVKVTDCLKD